MYLFLFLIEIPSQYPLQFVNFEILVLHILWIENFVATPAAIIEKAIDVENLHLPEFGVLFLKYYFSSVFLSATFLMR